MAPLTRIPHLPQNVLENVLSFLTSQEDRNAASLVCRWWYRVDAESRTDLFIGNCFALSPARATARFTCVKSVTLKGKPRSPCLPFGADNWCGQFSPWLLEMSTAYPWLEKLHLKRMSVRNVNLALLASSFPSFKELVLVSCIGLTTDGLAFVASGCRQLKVLDLIDSVIVDNHVDWISCFPENETSLESLAFDFSNCWINFDSLESLVARSPSLKKLRLNSSVSIDDLHRLMLRAPQLTDLGTGLFTSDVSDDSDSASDDSDVDEIEQPDYASAFSACKSLVSLSGFLEFKPEYLPAIYPLSCNLTSLDFSQAMINAEQLKPIIENCHKLQKFSALEEIEDEGLEMVAASCKDLRDLRVLRNTHEFSVSEIGLQAIAEGCRKLQSIRYYCKRMTNSAVIAMSRNCPDLVKFCLFIKFNHKTAPSMDSGFGAIVRNCKKLRSLGLSGMLTDKGFEDIGTYGKLIRSLWVYYVGDGNNGLGIRHVLEGCPNLKKVEIVGCPFGDSEAISAVRHYYNMRYMFVSKSTVLLSEYGCQRIAGALPSLRVEVVKSMRYDNKEKEVEAFYAYRSFEAPRSNASPFVSVL